MSAFGSVFAAAAMFLAALSLPAHAISDEALQALEMKAGEYCLTGSLTGASKREVQAILRKSMPLCRKYSRQLDRIRKSRK
jgi:hypothetical protein